MLYFQLATCQCNTDLNYLTSKTSHHLLNHIHNPIYSCRETQRRERGAGWPNEVISISDTAQSLFQNSFRHAASRSVCLPRSPSCRSLWLQPVHPSMSHMHTHTHVLGILLKTLLEKYFRCSPLLFSVVQ